MQVLSRIVLRRHLNRRQFVTTTATNCRRRSSSVPLFYEDLPAPRRQTGGDSSSPILITHGMLGSGSNWSSLAKALNRDTNRRVVVFDARNHGQSPHDSEMSYEAMARDVVALVRDSLGIEKAAFMGHSMGGRTLMLLSLMHPEIVEKLVVVDVSPVTQELTPESLDRSEFAQIFRAMQSVRFSQNATIPAARKDADKQLEQQGLSEPFIRSWLLMNMVQAEDGQIGWRCNVEHIFQGFKKNIATFSTSAARHASFSGPTLFVGGSRSAYIPQSDHQPIRRLFPAADIQYVEDAGHWVHAEKPHQFKELLLKFL